MCALRLVTIKYQKVKTDLIEEHKEKGMSYPMVAFLPQESIFMDERQLMLEGIIGMKLGSTMLSSYRVR